MYGKGFLGNMTENLQADCVQSRQAGFMQCFLILCHFFRKKASVFYEDTKNQIFSTAVSAMYCSFHCFSCCM